MDFGLNESLERNQWGMVRLQKIDSMIEQLELEHEELKHKEKELKHTLEKENDDVEKLEKMSIASVFYTILGRLDERAEKERQEALAARLSYDQVIKDLEDIKAMLLKLSTERLEYVDCPKNFNQLYIQKKQELIQQNGETAIMLLELTDKASLQRINLKEMKEALSAGQEVLNSLNRVLSNLESAEGWGTWDLLGGGLISDMVKHSHIDEAKREVEKVQHLLRQFKTELADINMSPDIFMKTEGFAKFADFFFDGLIADWIMQSRINESQANVQAVRSEVISVIEHLKNMVTEQNSVLERLEEEMKERIMQA